MDKRFQFYIAAAGVSASEQQRAMQALLAEEQLPVAPAGFDLRWEEDRQLIQRTIRASDYFLLLLGGKTDVGWVEILTSYALAQGLPVLCFVRENSPYAQAETDPAPLAAASVLRDILRGTKAAYPQRWQDPEELFSLVKKAAQKEAKKNTQPGWVRGNFMDIEQYCSELMRLTNRVHTLETMNADLQRMNTRHPKLRVAPLADIPRYTEQKQSTHGLIYRKDVTLDGHTVYFTPKSVYEEDVSQGLYYLDERNEQRYADKTTVRQLRHVMQNGFPLQLLVHNLGTARATGVRLHCTFPQGILVLSGEELVERTTPKTLCDPSNSVHPFPPQFFAPYIGSEKADIPERYIPFAELYRNTVLADLFNPAQRDENGVFFQGHAYFHRDEILQKDARGIQGLYFLAEKPGKYTITCEVMCNECADPFVDKVYIVVN